MKNIKNFSDIELTKNQTRALCLGQGVVVSKSFNSGNFLLDWNKFKNKIRWRLFLRDKDNSSPIHRYRKSSGRPAPVGSGFESKLMENVFLSCEKEFLSKEFKERAAKFKGNVTFLEKLGIKELISDPDITILMQDKSKQLVVINTSEHDSKMETILLLDDNLMVSNGKISLSSSLESNADLRFLRIILCISLITV